MGTADGRRRKPGGHTTIDNRQSDLTYAVTPQRRIIASRTHRLASRNDLALPVAEGGLCQPRQVWESDAQTQTITVDNAESFTFGANIENVFPSFGDLGGK